MLVPAKPDGVTPNKAVISRNFCVVFPPFSLIEQLTSVLFLSKAPIVAYEVEIEAGLFPQPLKHPPSPPHPTLRGCASAKFDWMNVRRGL
jgi:hypothetical protein